MELALSVPIVLLLALIIVEVALVARFQIEVVAAAREGARVAATNPDPADAVAAAVGALGARGADARINVHRPHVVGADASVSVWIDYAVRVPFIGGPTIPLSSTAVMRVER